MLCPLCKSKLITDPDEPSFIFEDDALSIIHTTKHICDNIDCELYHKSYWNDYMVKLLIEKLENKNLLF